MLTIALRRLRTIPLLIFMIFFQMKKIVKKFETFAKETGYAPFNHMHHDGYWKQLTVRTSRTGEILLWAILHPQNLVTTVNSRVLVDPATSRNICSKIHI